MTPGQLIVPRHGLGSLDASPSAGRGDRSGRESGSCARRLARRREPASKFAGSWPGASASPTATLAPGDRVGSLEVVAAPGHTPGQVAFLDTRDRTLYCADAYTTLGGVATSAAPNWRFPLSSMATWDRPTALRTAVALRALDPARLAPATAPSSRSPLPRWTPRSPRPADVPRQGLDRERVVDAAVAIADADGLEAVTLARVAADLGVRPPSLYNHVDGREALLREVSLRGIAGLSAALGGATVGRSGNEALEAMAHAYRTYAGQHPGCYAATVAAPAAGDAEHAGAAARPVEIVIAVIRPWQLGAEEELHAVRVIRSALHGFIALESGGGFALPLDLDASFAALVRTLSGGLDAQRAHSA